MSVQRLKATYANGRVDENYDVLDFPEGVFKVKEVGPGVYMQEKKHWAMNVYAGEGIVELVDEEGGHEGGCIIEKEHPLRLCMQPKIVTYRHYWSKKGRISCFLSYPNGMAIENRYFWEIYCLEGGLFKDVERFYTEEEMEKRVIELLEG